MSIQSVASSIPTVPSANNPNGGLVGKDEFLKLLVTQLQKQDPLNPQDPSEFTAQLAQFSSLEQLIGVNDNLTSLGSLQGASIQLGAAALIGKSARVLGDRLEVDGGTADTVKFNLSREAEQVSVNVYDSAGKLVEVVDYADGAAGDHAFMWTAKPGGTAAADGTYRFEVVASDSNDTVIEVATSFTGRVTAVSFERGEAMVTVGGDDYAFGDVIGILGE